MTPAAGTGAAARRVLLVHGAGGGAWEYCLWMPVLRAAGWSPEAVELQPRAVETGGLAATRFEDYLEQVVQAGRQHESDVLEDAGGFPRIALFIGIRCCSTAVSSACGLSFGRLS